MRDFSNVVAVVVVAAVVVVVFKVSVFVSGISLLHFEGLLGLLLHLMHDCYSMVQYGTVSTPY